MISLKSKILVKFVLRNNYIMKLIKHSINSHTETNSKLIILVKSSDKIKSIVYTDVRRST